MKTKVLLITIAIIFVSSNVSAGWLAGNDLVTYAKEWKKSFDGSDNANTYEVGKFQMYVAGVVDGLDGVSICLPENATGGQMLSIVYKYIDSHPEKWSNSALSLVYSPLSETFPCKKK